MYVPPLLLSPLAESRNLNPLDRMSSHEYAVDSADDKSAHNVLLTTL